MKNKLFNYTQEQIDLIRKYRRLQLLYIELGDEQDMFNHYDGNEYKDLLIELDSVIKQFMASTKIEIRSEAIKLLHKLGGI